MKKRSGLAPYALIAPYMLFFMVFGLIPLVLCIVISLTKWNYVSPMEYIGLDNFRLVFGLIGSGKVSRDFWQSVLHTLLFVIVETPLLIIIPLLLATLIVRCSAVRKFSMGFFYFPTILSITTVCILWNYLLDTNAGIINRLLGAELPWITQMPYAWLSIFMMSTWWGIGGNMILYVSALLNVPQEIIEAARIDGAGSGRIFFNIKLPSIRTTLLYTIITTTIGSFNMLGQAQVLTAGGPNYGTRTAMMLIYDTAFGGTNNFGRACAMAIIFGLIMLVFTISAYKLQTINSEE